MRTDILLDVFIVCLQVVCLEATHLLRLFHQNHPLVPTRGSLLTVNNYFGSNSGNTNNNGGGGGGGSSSSTGLTLHGGTNTGNNGASRQVWDQFEDNNFSFSSSGDCRLGYEYVTETTYQNSFQQQCRSDQNGMEIEALRHSVSHSVTLSLTQSLCYSLSH